jgi:L-2-hydroxycarboxylate dehydrogenase (NAD+)
MSDESAVCVPVDRLRRLCERVFRAVGLSEADAAATTDVLLTADLRGIDSHGVARLGFYVRGLENGMMIAQPQRRVISNTAVASVIDAGGGMGQPVSCGAMTQAISKAEDVGVGFVAVRNSNHFGIAGYYAMMALEHDCIGISMTNSFVFVVPTFARDAMLGTNPIAVAIPAGMEQPFVLDMATSTVPFGKLEVYDRLGLKLPAGWAVNGAGNAANDTPLMIKRLHSRESNIGGLTPLGGAGELLGGHKGYGLALLVEILCAVLSGSKYADLLYPMTEDGEPMSCPSGIGHFLGAIKVEAFRPLEEFQHDMDDLIRRLKDAPKADGQDRVYVHGEKEFEEADRRAAEGIPLSGTVIAELAEIAGTLGIPIDL